MNEALGMMVDDARNLDSRLSAAASSLNTMQPQEAFLTATITSPPYSDLIDYGTSNQIGFGQSEAEYLEDCRQTFATLHRWTKSNGVLWLVAESHLSRTPESVGVSRLNPLPFRLAEIAESVGWILREVVIWRKDRTRPWTHKGKFRKSFEHILLLVKGPDYKFHADRLRDSSDLTRWWVQYPERYNSLGKAPENVWDIPIPLQGSWGRKAYQHACPLPPELVRRLVLLSTDEDDVVCDPFGGIGTVPGVALAMKRKTISTEINPQFVDYYEQHLKDEVREQLEEAQNIDTTGPTPETIVSLRLLKFPKVAFNKIKSSNVNQSMPSHLIVDAEVINSDRVDGKLGKATWYFVLPESTPAERESMAAVLKATALVAPLSKFQVAGELLVIDEAEAFRVLGTGRWSVYEHGQTWIRTREATAPEFLSIPNSVRRGSYPPVASNVAVSIVLKNAGRLD